MSSTKEFELVYEGPADESADTLRKLRTSLLADAGLSIPEVQETLSNTPKTIKTSELEDDLKPLYAALKKAGGKVLIVRPAEATNEKAYFLDLEESQLDDDLLKSLEALPGDEESSRDDGDVAVDLTQELKDFIPAEEEVPVVAASPAPVPLTPAVTPASVEVSIAPPVTASIELTAEPILSPPPSPAEIPAPPAIETTIKPLDDKPLFEFSSPAEMLEPTSPAPKAAGPEVPDLKASKPLFEFGSSADTPAAVEEKKEEIPATAAPAKPSSIFDDLTLDLEEPSPGPAPAAVNAVPATDTADKSSKAPQEENPFSSDDLSMSLNSQLESEIANAPAAPVTAAPSALSLSVEKESAAEKPPPVTTKSREPVRPGAPVTAPSNPNIVIEPEGAAHSPLPAAAVETEVPAAVAFKSTLPKEQASLDLILPILVGAILLGIANWLYFKPGSDDAHLPKLTFPEMNEEAQDEGKRRREKIPSTEKTVSGKSAIGALSLSWGVLFDKEELKNVTIEATTPQPPALTPEQIVRAERPSPWLYKIEVSQFPFEKQLDGTWQAKGPARVFVSQGRDKRRLVAQAEITLESFKAGESVVGRVVISRGLPNMQSKEPFHFEQLINGDILLFVSSDLK